MTNDSSQNQANSAAAHQPGSGVRHLLDAAVCLALAVILFRAFQVEGYMISTGSMAPTLLGYHKRVVCPSCRFPFAVGAVELDSKAAQAGGPTSAARALRPVDRPATCPNCGQGPIDVSAVPRSQGDQLLVHKHAFLIAPPRRWEVAVFRNPYKPVQAYVKRIVGLPGESIQIIAGDVYVNGSIARKSLRAQRSIRIPVYDDSFRPDDEEWQPRWTAEAARSAWTVTSDGFDLSGGGREAAAGNVQEPAWVQYRHLVRAPARRKAQRLSAVTDVYGYNGPDDAPAKHALRDLMLSAHVALRSGDGEFVVEMTDGEQTILCVIDRGQQEIRLLAGRRGKTVRRARLADDAFSAQQQLHLEFSLFDRQALVAVNGRLPFDPWPLPAANPKEPASASPVQFGARGLSVKVSQLKLFRDVYYTRGNGTNAINEPYRLRGDQYFVLGDNSPVSLDGRSWADGALDGRLLIGKPFLVHLPSKPGKVRFGRREAHFRIPDLSRIRYIR